MDYQQRQAVLAARDYLARKQAKRDRRNDWIDAALFAVFFAVLLCMTALPNSYN